MRTNLVDKFKTGFIVNNCQNFYVKNLKYPLISCLHRSYLLCNYCNFDINKTFFDKKNRGEFTLISITSIAINICIKLGKRGVHN